MENSAVILVGQQQALQNGGGATNRISECPGVGSFMYYSVTGWQRPCDGGQASPRDSNCAQFHVCWASSSTIKEYYRGHLTLSERSLKAFLRKWHLIRKNES